MALEAFGGTLVPTQTDRRAASTVAKRRIAPEMPDLPRWTGWDIDAAGLLDSPLTSQPPISMQRLGLADITKASFTPTPDKATEMADLTAGMNLASTGSTKGMNPSFAAALAKANAAMKAAGLEGFSITSGYRTKAQQQALYDAYLRGEGNLAAPPGRSLHEQGRAVDLNWSQLNDRQRAWLRANLPRFGITPIKSEAWHWQYLG